MCANTYVCHILVQMHMYVIYVYKYHMYRPEPAAEPKAEPAAEPVAEPAAEKTPPLH